MTPIPKVLSTGCLKYFGIFLTTSLSTTIIIIYHCHILLLNIHGMKWIFTNLKSICHIHTYIKYTICITQVDR
jgi:hypothetical protein